MALVLMLIEDSWWLVMLVDGLGSPDLRRTWYLYSPTDARKTSEMLD
jgi:hypothetical protein